MEERGFRPHPDQGSHRKVFDFHLVGGGGGDFTNVLNPAEVTAFVKFISADRSFSTVSFRIPGPGGGGHTTAAVSLDGDISFFDSSWGAVTTKSKRDLATMLGGIFTYCYFWKGLGQGQPKTPDAIPGRIPKNQLRMSQLQVRVTRYTR